MSKTHTSVNALPSDIRLVALRLMTLPPLQKAVLELFYSDCFSFTQIANILELYDNNGKPSIKKVQALYIRGLTAVMIAKDKMRTARK